MADDGKEISRLLQELQTSKKRIAELEGMVARFSRFAENAHDVAYLVRLKPDRAYEYITPGIEKITGYAPQDYYRDPELPFKIIHPEDRALLTNLYTSPSSMGDLHTFRFIRKDGSEVWTERRIVPIRDESGEIVAIEGVIRDITERKKAEAALLESHEELERKVRERTAELNQSEQTLRALLNATNDMAVLLGSDGTILQANENAARKLGKPIEELIGTNGYAGFSPTVARRRKEMNETVLKTGKPLRYEDEWDGRYSLISLFPLIGIRGEPMLAIFARDITDEKKAKQAVLESEAKYRLLADSATDIIWMRDMNLRLTYISPAVFLVRGFTPDEALAQDITESMTAESVEAARRMFSEELSLEQQRPKDLNRSRTIEVEMLRKDGTTVWTEVTVRFLRDEQGNPTSILGISRNITDRKEAERALRESEESARLQFKHFPIPTYTWQRRGDDFLLMDYNLAAETITQGRIADYLWISLSELYRDQASIRDDIHRCFNEKSSFKTEVDYQFQSTGETRLLVVHYTFVPPDKVIINTEDVTDRVLAEIALLESEEMFRAVTETAADAIFCKDMEGRYTLANPAMERLLNLPASRIIGRKAEELFDQEAVVAIREADGPALRGEINSGVWSMNVGPERYTFHVVEVPLLDSADRVRGICGIVRDISDLQKAEQALRESEEKFRTITTSALDAVMLIDAEGNAVFWNPAAENTFGYSKEEILGKNIHEILMPEHYRESFQKGFAHFRNTGTGNAVGKVLELTARHKNGTEFPIEIAVSPIVLQGQYWATAIIRDITDRKRVQKETYELNAFRENIIDNANIWLNVLDADMNVVVWNKAAEAISGYSRDEVVGHPQIWQWLYPEEAYRREVTGKAASIIEQGEMVEGFETTIVRKDGEPRIISWFSRNLLDLSGNIIGSLALGLDVTSRHRAEEEKEALQDQLYHAQKMETVGTLAGGIAHDVNNILQTIFNNLYLSMEELEGDHPAISHLQGILRAGRRAKDLIDQILTFSRHMDHERKPVEIAPLVKEVVKMLQQAVPPDIRITHRIQAGCGVILADPSQIHQVIMNLATNAIHAMREHGGLLEIQLRHLDTQVDEKPPSVNLAPGHYIHLILRDTGHGMDKGTMARIFEPFFTTKKVGEGTGLGLSVAHGIVTSHGGRIAVESEVNKGTLFHIYLPCVERQAEPESAALPGPFRGRGTLLFVDDEMDQLRLSHMILTRAGYDVTSVSSAGEALAAFRTNPRKYQLVITDQMMPVMSGIEMAMKMFRMRPDLKVILITGKADQDTRIQAEKLGIAKVIAKPADPADLILAIQEILSAPIEREV